MFRKRFTKRFRKRKAPKVGKKLRRAIGSVIKRTIQAPEMKQAVMAVGGPNIMDDATGVLKCLVLGNSAGLDFSVGASGNQRLGTEVWLKKIEYKYTIGYNQSFNGCPYRRIVFCLHKPDPTAALAVSDLYVGTESMFDTASSGGFSINYSYNNDAVGKGKKYTIISDRIFNPVIYNVNLPGSFCGSRNDHVTINFPGKGSLLECDAGNTVGETLINNKNYYCFFIQGGEVANNASIVVYNQHCLISYQDA